MSIWGIVPIILDFQRHLMEIWIHFKKSDEVKSLTHMMFQFLLFDNTLSEIGNL